LFDVPGTPASYSFFAAGARFERCRHLPQIRYHRATTFPGSVRRHPNYGTVDITQRHAWAANGGYAFLVQRDWLNCALGPPWTMAGNDYGTNYRFVGQRSFTLNGAHQCGFDKRLRSTGDQ
jgi:hypothetical protein